MKIFRIILMVLCQTAFLTVLAQNRSFVLMETNPEYGQQSWFYSGVGCELDASKIKKFWDEDKYITSVAYTKNGWFVTMSKDVNYTGQSYKYDKAFPSDWIKEKWNQNYYITAISCSESKWLVVMSKYKGYSQQSYNHSSGSELDNWYKEKRSSGYVLTSASYSSGKWWWVMTKGQTYKHKDMIGLQMITFPLRLKKFGMKAIAFNLLSMLVDII